MQTVKSPFPRPRRTRAPLALLLAAGVLAAGAPRGQAEVILSDLADNAAPITSYIGTGSSPAWPFAAGSANATVTSVVVPIGSGGPGPEVMKARIYSADGADGRPGTLRGEFAYASAADGLGTYTPTNTTPSGAALTANATYWIAISNTGSAGSFLPFSNTNVINRGEALTFSGLAGYAFTSSEVNSNGDAWPSAPGSDTGRRLMVGLFGNVTPDATPTPTPGVTPPPGGIGKPTVQIKGPTRITTSKALVPLSGTTTNSTFVEYQAGKLPARPTSGKPAAWTAMVRVNVGTTVVEVRARGFGGMAIDKVTVVRKK